MTSTEKFARYWEQQKQTYKNFISEMIHNGILDIQEIQSIINDHLNAQENNVTGQLDTESTEETKTN